MIQCGAFGPATSTRIALQILLNIPVLGRGVICVSQNKRLRSQLCFLSLPPSITVVSEKDNLFNNNNKNSNYDSTDCVKNYTKGETVSRITRKGRLCQELHEREMVSRVTRKGDGVKSYTKGRLCQELHEREIVPRVTRKGDCVKSYTKGRWCQELHEREMVSRVTRKGDCVKSNTKGETVSRVTRKGRLCQELHERGDCVKNYTKGRLKVS